ncbi:MULTISPECIES: hypothetical protein [unclassified Microcoleus]
MSTSIAKESDRASKRHLLSHGLQKPLKQAIGGAIAFSKFY